MTLLYREFYAVDCYAWFILPKDLVEKGVDAEKWQITGEETGQEGTGQARSLVTGELRNFPNEEMILVLLD